MSALHDSIHWIIDHLNVTQEEKDEQHSVVTSDEPQTHSTETEADAPEYENI